MKHIRPSDDLKSHYDEISIQCKETKEPVFITVNGHKDTVIMNVADYMQLISEIELLKMIIDSENDVENNHIQPFTNSLSNIRKILQWYNQYKSIDVSV